jgi:hypothetical protein
MAVQIHAPVQDANDLNAAVHLAVKDHMHPLGIPAIARPGAVAGAPKGRALGQGVEAKVELGQVGVALPAPQVRWV